jgi:hypothetical protein
MKRLLTPMVLAALAAFAPAASAQNSPPADFLGVVSEDAFAGSDAERDAAFRAQARAGVRLVRQPFHWSGIELSPGRFALQPYDRFVTAAARHGIRVMPILFDAPQFRERAPATGRYPPASFRDMVTFTQVLWLRYGPDGSLWRQFPDLPKLPVRAWQIWNEPNLRSYWPRKPNAADYGRMLKQVAGILSAIDPSAEVVTGGLPASRLRGSVPVAKYVRELDRRRAPFDTLGVHAYARDERELIRNLRKLRRVLDRSGRRGTRIWITELGWSDRGPRSRFRLGRRGQARMIAETFRALERERRRLRLRGVVYQSWKDGRPYAPRFNDFWGLHTGLLRLNGTPKPAFRSFRRTARQLGWAGRG